MRTIRGIKVSTRCSKETSGIITFRVAFFGLAEATLLAACFHSSLGLMTMQIEIPEGVEEGDLFTVK